MIWIIIAVGVLLVMCLIWYITVLNLFNQKKVKIEEAKSGIDVALTKRYDVLTKMMDTVKAYASHEKEMLFGIVNLRKDMTVKEQAEASSVMDENYRKCLLLAEDYPDLRSSENYNTLQAAIADTEEHLQAARRLYNANVSAYNQKLVTFPEKIVANARHFEKYDFFEAEEEKREDVKIDL